MRSDFARCPHHPCYGEDRRRHGSHQGVGEVEPAHGGQRPALLDPDPAAVCQVPGHADGGGEGGCGEPVGRQVQDGPNGGPLLPAAEADDFREDI